ncbi:hypothetical protein ACQPZ2_09920 [Nocardia pseudovaccinii]|uniref:hypothetical protein n=1 Tax=Nocardia pseudovaccinii TaxID=189540 RepID=UPI003D8CE6A4
MNKDIRSRLFAAYQAGDMEAFVTMCRDHTASIVASFPSWQTVPEYVRENREAVERWVGTLLAIAQVLAANGYPQAMATLMPAGHANPINAWHDQFVKAERLSNEGRHADSAATLERLLVELHGSTGPGIDDLLTKITGLLGVNAMRCGEFREAAHYTEDALRRCEDAGDREGAWIYAENLDAVVVARELESGTDIGAQLARCRERIAFAQDLSDTGRYQGSNAVLHELLDELADHRNAGRRYLGKVYGLLGLNCFRLNEMTEAKRYTERAVTECRNRNDHFGDRIYSANLTVIDRA